MANIQKQSLDIDFMNGIYNFVMNNYIIRKYMDINKKNLFEKGWNVINNNNIIVLFEKPVFKNYCEDCLFKLKIFQNIFGFYIYYVVKDIFKWMNKYTTTIKDLGRDLNQHDKFIYPFGFVNIDTVNIYMVTDRNKMGYKLIAEPKNKELLRKYDFFITDINFMEETLRLSNYYASINNPSRNFFDYIDNQNNERRINLVKPRTIFKHIKKNWYKLEEAIISRNDANFTACHPETFIVPAPLKDIPLESLTSDNLYAQDDIENAQEMNNQKRSRMFLGFAQKMLEGMRKDSTIGGSQDINIRKIRKHIFNHPDMNDGVVLLPAEAAQVHSTHSPQTIIDINDELQNFEKNIAEIFSIPYDLYSHQQKSKNTPGASHSLESVIKLMEKDITIQQLFINDIFIDLYQNSFGKIENEILKQKISIKQTFNNEKNDELNQYKSELKITKLVFLSKRVIFNEQVLILMQLAEKELIPKGKLSSIINEWI